MTSAAARRLPLLAALAASVACLAAALGMAVSWAAACVVPLPAVLLWLSPRMRGGWAGPVFLVVMTGAAAVSAVAGAPAWLAVPGAAFALAAWDLAQFDRFLGRDGHAEPAHGTVRMHLVALARAVGLGLLVAAGGFALSLSIPFAAVLLLVILDLLSIGLALRLLRPR